MTHRFHSVARRLAGLYALRATVFAVFSAIAAYSVANAFSEFVNPTIAAILSLSAIKTSLNDTGRETVKQTAGSFFGALLGLGLVSAIGFNAASIAVIVVVSMAAGFAIRLQVPGGLAIAATAILVSGPLFGDFQSIEQRVAGVFVGAVFALIASWFIVPWNPHKKYLEQGLALGGDVVDLMNDVAKKYRKSQTPSARTVDQWLERIDGIESSLRAVKRSAEQLRADARWTPFIKETSALRVYEQLTIVKANASALKTIVLAIENACEHNVVLSEPAAKRVAKLLLVAAAGIHEQLEISQGPPPDAMWKKKWKKAFDCGAASLQMR